MKTGVILYVLGNQILNIDDASKIQAAKRLLPKADHVEFISTDFGHWDIPDAWWSLHVRGMHRIVLNLAEYSTEDGLKITGREMRLSG